MRPVAITGIGIVSPLGSTRETTWLNLCAGKSGAGKLRQFACAKWPVQIACEVKDVPVDETEARPNTFAKLAAKEALADAGIETLSDIESNIYVGAGIGAVSPQEILNLLLHYDLEPGLRGATRYMLDHPLPTSTIARHHPSQTATMLQELTGSVGARRTFNTACAASAQAIGHGFRAVISGNVDVALVGGTDSIAGQILTIGFCLLGVLSKQQEPSQASRPFDKNRDGFVVGEGSAFLVLESAERAAKRGANIYATVCGYGESENAYRITDLPPDGRGAKQAIQAAVGARMLDVAVVSAHGTSTTQNDAVESGVIESCFPHGPKVIALKSATGHPIAASGALQVALSALCIKERVLPPILNLSETDCAVLNYVTHLQPMVGDYLLSNSFGFGGTNAALLLGHPCTLTV